MKKKERERRTRMKKKEKKEKNDGPSVPTLKERLTENRSMNYHRTFMARDDILVLLTRCDPFI